MSAKKGDIFCETVVSATLIIGYIANAVLYNTSAFKWM